MEQKCLLLINHDDQYYNNDGTKMDSRYILILTLSTAKIDVSTATSSLMEQKCLLLTMNFRYLLSTAFGQENKSKFNCI